MATRCLQTKIIQHYVFIMGKNRCGLAGIINQKKIPTELTSTPDIYSTKEKRIPTQSRINFVLSMDIRSHSTERRGNSGGEYVSRVFDFEL